MKLRNKIISTITPLSILVLANSSAFADTYLMKDGTTINGSILRETADSYVLRAEVTNNVYAEKTVLKSNVAEITKTDPSIAAYEKLTSILPTSDLMDLDEYETIISSKVAPFIKDYPSSPHLEDAEKLLKTLKNEYHTIKSGGIKLNGKLLTAEDIEADKYNVQASIGYNKFVAYAKRKQYRAALSTLENMEDGYSDTKQYRKAQKLALSILPLYEEKLQKLHDNVDELIAKRERALEGMTPGDKSRTAKIFEREEQQYQNLLDQTTASKKKVKWLPINSYFIDPIENNLKMVPSEVKRISSAIEKPTIDVGSFYKDTYSALEAGDYPKAKENFDLFKRAKPPEAYIDEFEPKLDAAKAVMEQMEDQRKADEKLAKEKAKEAEKAAREQAKEDAKNGNKKGKKLPKKAIDNIKKKQDLEKRLSQ